MIYPKRHDIAFASFVFALVAVVGSFIGFFFYAVTDGTRYQDQWLRNTRIARDMYLSDCAQRGALLKECASDWDRSVTLRTIYREKVSTLRSVDLPRVPKENGF